MYFISQLMDELFLIDVYENTPEKLNFYSHIKMSVLE